MRKSDEWFLSRYIKWGAIAALVLIYFFTYKDSVKEKLAQKAEEVETERQESAPADMIIPKVTLTTPAGEGNDKAPQMLQSVAQSIVNKIAQTEGGRKVIKSLSEQANTDANGNAGMGSIKTLFPFNQPNSKKVYLSDVTNGFGARVACNATVTYDYRAYLPSNAKFSTSYLPEHVPVSIIIGKNQVLPGLEIGMIGMQGGGRRKIFIPPFLGYNAPGFERQNIYKDKIVMFDVEVRAVENGRPTIPYDEELYKLETVRDGSQSDYVKCGHQVSLSYQRISSHEKSGNLLEEAAPKQIRFTVGDAPELPTGMREALVGLKRGGVYRITLSPYWQQIFSDDSPLNTLFVDVGKYDDVIVEFSILAIES